MDLFSYLTIALAFVYTAAVLRLIGGFSYAINKENRYSVHLILIITTILFIVLSFWTTWGLKQIDWTLPKFLLKLIDPILWFFISTVLVPANPKDIRSWKTYYYKNKTKYFGALLILLVYLLVHDTVFINQSITHPAKIAILMGLIPVFFGLRSSNHKVHLAIGLFLLLEMLIMSFTIAAEPGWGMNQ